MPDKIGKFKILYAPVINNEGKIAFIATADGAGVGSKNNYALLTFHYGKLEIVGRAGNTIPQGGGNFASLPGDALGPFRGAPRLNDTGEIAFLGAYDPDGGKLYASKVGIFAAGKKIVLDGDPLVDAPTQHFLLELDLSNPPALSGNNTVVFGAAVEGNSIEERRGGLYFFKTGALKKISSRGDSVPDKTAKFDTPSVEDWLGFGPAVINQKGAVAFIARQKLTDISQLSRYDNAFREALYLYSDGRLVRIAGSGDSFPALRGNIEYIYTVKFSPDINSSNRVAIQGSGGGDEYILVANPSIPLDVVAKTGEPAPENGMFSQLRWQPSLNDRGEILFAGKVKEGTLSGSDALFLKSETRLRTVVKRGDPVPEGNGTFYELTNSDKFLQVNANRLNLTERGDFAFLSSVLNENGSTDLGLYVYHDGKIKKIVRSGDHLMDKKVKDIGFNTVESSGVRGLNDSCQIAFVTEFEDGAYAIWIADGCN